VGRTEPAVGTEAAPLVPASVPQAHYHTVRDAALMAQRLGDLMAHVAELPYPDLELMGVVKRLTDQIDEMMDVTRLLMALRHRLPEGDPEVRRRRARSARVRSAYAVFMADVRAQLEAWSIAPPGPPPGPGLRRARPKQDDAGRRGP
jgi:hypothetical protein